MGKDGPPPKKRNLPNSQGIETRRVASLRVLREAWHQVFTGTRVRLQLPPRTLAIDTYL